MLVLFAINMPIGMLENMQNAHASKNSLIARLDLSDPASLDINFAADEVLKATAESGFVYINISSSNASIIENARRAQHAFFALSHSEKQKIAIDDNNRGYLAQGMASMRGATRKDQKEVFFWGREADGKDPDVLAGLPLCGPNQWPEIEGFREAILDYSKMIQTIGDKLLQIFAVALGARATFFETHYQRCMLRGQLLCYPPTDDHPEQFGVAPHSDFGCITLLLQETAGLEVLFPSGQWVAAPPIENTLVINIGDLLERWSNNKLPSTKHRVRNLSPDARYSIAMFYDPNPGAIVDPHELLPREASKYQPVKSAEYILGRNKGVFEHYKVDNHKE